MSRLDQLPPDQRAALSLLLRQRKSYAEVAKLLGIPEHAVHDRAQVALAVLAPLQARDVTPDRRKEIGDYLLGQQPGVAERLRTRTLLSSSEPARAWASEVASQLAPLGDTSLPDIPPAAPAPQRLQDLSAATAAAGSPAGGTPPPPASSAARSPRSSRLGGAVLLGVILVAIVVAVVLLSGGSSGKKSKTTASKTSSTSSTKTGPTVENQISLKPPSGSKSASIGVVDVLVEDGKRAFFIEAQHIPASKGFYYAIWLYNSPSNSLALSKSPAVGSTHRLAGGSLLPSAAGKYQEILLTRETKAHPKRPGHVVLRGPFSLKG
jgi:Sigma-70, region 4